MKYAVISLVLGAGALFASGANAAPLPLGVTTLPGNVENVRLVCDDYGRCYRTRGPRRVIVQPGYESYNYAPRYVERRYYGDGYYGGPGVGVGVGPVGVGIGFGPRW